MKRSAFVILFVLNTFSGSLLVGLDASSEMKSDRLPQQGAWARYQGSTRKDGGAESVSQSSHRTLNDSVVNDKPCRWFEV